MITFKESLATLQKHAFVERKVRHSIEAEVTPVRGLLDPFITVCSLAGRCRQII